MRAACAARLAKTQRRNPAARARAIPAPRRSSVLTKLLNCAAPPTPKQFANRGLTTASSCMPPSAAAIRKPTIIRAWPTQPEAASTKLGCVTELTRRASICEHFGEAEQHDERRIVERDHARDTGGRRCKQHDVARPERTVGAPAVNRRGGLAVGGRSNHAPVAGRTEHVGFEHVDAPHSARVPIAEWRRL